MRFGTFFFFQAVPWLRPTSRARELEQMEWTEELGFDQIWLTEHHFIDYGLAVDPARSPPWPLAHARVRIGLAAAILPFHHPLRLAEQTALVDIVSRGRLEVGSAAAIARRSSAATTCRSRRTATASRRRWRSSPRRGRRRSRSRTRDASSDPRHPRDAQAVPEAAPAALPGVRQQGEHRGHAARGWPMLNSVLRGNAEQQLATNREAYVTALRKAGRSDADIASLLKRWGVSRQIYVAPTDAQAQPSPRTPRCGTGVVPPLRDPRAHREAHPSSAAALPATRRAARQAQLGRPRARDRGLRSPDTVARKIEAMRDAGVGHVLCWMNFGGCRRTNPEIHGTLRERGHAAFSRLSRWGPRRAPQTPRRVTQRATPCRAADSGSGWA